MANQATKQVLTDLLAEADVQINGTRPWDIVVKNDAFFTKILRDGSLGFGESYMDGDWECDAIDELLAKVLSSEIKFIARKHKKLILHALKAKVFNQQRKSKAFEVAEVHYDAGNNIYQHMLDKRMVYTCAYWKDAKTLDEAQEAKLDLVCRKLGLKKGMHVLDLGGGWGSFAKFAAEKYGVSVVNVTVSKEQVALANERCKGLPIENRLMDYRQINEKFDRIASIGMLEAVGYKNYRTYMEVAYRCLKDGGLFLLHTIGGNRSTVTGEPWTQKYIFPNGMLPSVKQIGESIEDLFVLEDWHSFGADYDKTLMCWWDNFDKAWPELKDKYGDRFYRMWKLYLLSCAGTFRARSNQLWQIVLAKPGVPGGYESIR